ncbi:nicotinamide/nicotinate mononucleotide adenylyltransferase [Fadolivirus algeromassiliense]|jgi:nicotinate-nucleotide adenylyltransferase|uniref:Nicotinamide/nicotinate mononucleotide adenylyltransferase n=1 Tax=Fadolivirus FV1/VV64 TaxID=3070911 RepID=A0A7D3QWB1_9VIRU|nr:nicotinamide/nicotinate mononucleotide adenylyltransferase [Fadolivirus algeromassiliense]QKF94306.1 nicotinamide/nicotinate mononucleotide adenylyltransferase [Fadolivirus FV1/VV64]
MIKTVIFGGAFNPIGTHHLEIANKLLTIFDEVWITPCYKSITGKVLEDAEDRVNMCNIAIQNNGKSKIKLCDFEIRNKLHDESSVILDKFLNHYSNFNRKFYFVIGMDNATTINKWQNWENLIKMIPFIVLPRKGYSESESNMWYYQYPHIFLKDILIGDFSSTLIRKDLMKNGESGDIDEDVLEYIKKHHLYLPEH